MRGIALAATALLALTGVFIAPAHAATKNSATWKPAAMAAVGDSITRAFDIDWSHVLADSPQYSWSTGTSTSVNSQYRRLLAIDPGLAGHEYNLAKTGANMANLDGQVQQAASLNVGYLTVLMGANDVCRKSISTMTPTAIFQSEFQTALSDFFAADPTGHMYVSSLPNIFELWTVLHNNWFARNAWQTFNICGSMLSTSNTAADRQKVVAQEVADNNALMTVCHLYANCRWDNLAGYNFNFPATDIDTVDYFHPNLAGQNAVAALSWTASYWGS